MPSPNPERRKLQLRKKRELEDAAEPLVKTELKMEQDDDYKPEMAGEDPPKQTHDHKRFKEEEEEAEGPKAPSNTKLALRIEDRSLSISKLRDVLCGMLRIFKPREWLTAPEIALRMRAAPITLQDIKDSVGDNKYTLSCFLLSFPDAFIQQTIWDYRHLCAEINSGAIMAPAGKFPSLPLCRWSISKKIETGLEEYVYGCNKIPAPQPRTCIHCRNEGNVWYGHHESYCRRYKLNSGQLHARHTSGVAVPASILISRNAEKERLEQQWKAYEELKRGKEELLNRKKKNPWTVTLGNELPFTAGDEVTAVELDIPESRFQFMIGREGKNIQLLQEQYGILIKIPFKGSSKQKAYIKGRVDKVRDAKILLEEKYNDPEYDVYQDVIKQPPERRQPHQRGRRL
eukprot:TRINITY_DN3458_c0_g1_i1.p1 TRINITY_DN3458_c0_g1~~TRINITY_DN3458_c0_g1_i1.p1  ORF type:complete len:435 (+),score=90.29 TRINITY_DN3458_c0_g1_i1:105-1307(+)